MKTKLTVIIFAILLIPVFSLQAGIRIGAKAGVNLANASFSTDAIKPSNYTGFQVGPIVELSALGLGFDAAALYSQRGFKSTELEQKTSTLDVPVNLKFKFSLMGMLGAYVSAGPYVSFKLNDKITDNNLAQISDYWKSKSFGAGLNFGFGVEVIKHLQVGANYQLGLTNDYSTLNVLGTAGSILGIGNVNAKTRIWSITAAYFF